MSENLAEALRSLPTNELDEIDSDLEHNYFFVDFDSLTNQEEIMDAYSYLYHMLGSFSRKARFDHNSKT